MKRRRPSPAERRARADPPLSDIDDERVGLPLVGPGLRALRPRSPPPIVFSSGKLVRIGRPVAFRRSASEGAANPSASSSERLGVAASAGGLRPLARTKAPVTSAVQRQREADEGPSRLRLPQRGSRCAGFPPRTAGRGPSGDGRRSPRSGRSGSPERRPRQHVIGHLRAGDRQAPVVVGFER